MFQGDTLQVLLRLDGGGKRAREGGAELTKDEKTAMLKHQLGALITRVLTCNNIQYVPI